MKHEFIGPFKNELEGFIAEARTLGRKYIEEERTLHKLDEMSINYDCSKGLPKELVLAFVENQPHWHGSTQEKRVFIARKAAIYLNKCGIQAYVCETNRIMKTDSHFQPYIFTNDEIARILQCVDEKRPARSNQRNHLFYPVVLRILYCCGLRISEALNLHIRDVNLNEGVFYVKNAKHHKDRLVPMNDLIKVLCTEYFKKFHPIYKDDDYFFDSPCGGAYTQTTVYHYFRSILFECGFSHGGRNSGGPRLHDLRHTFCIHSLRQFLENGIDYRAALPILSAYMGHSSLSATGKYLRLTAEAYPEIASQMESRYGDLIPMAGGKCI